MMHRQVILEAAEKREHWTYHMRHQKTVMFGPLWTSKALLKCQFSMKQGGF